MGTHRTSKRNHKMKAIQNQEHASEAHEIKTFTPPFCFVTEGHTEADYLEKILGLQGTIINAKGGSVNATLKRAIQEVDSYRTVFVVFDTDKNLDLKRYKIQVSAYPNLIPISNSPNIDWLVLWHRGLQQPSFTNQDDLKNQIKTYCTTETNYKTVITNDERFRSQLKKNRDEFFQQLAEHEQELIQKGMNPKCIESRITHAPNSAMGQLFELRPQYDYS